MGMPFRVVLFQKWNIATASPDYLWAKFSDSFPARKPLTTSGSSTTVTAVTAGDGPLDEVGVGDELHVHKENSDDVVFLASKSDGDNGVVSAAVNWEVGPQGGAGRHFRIRKFLSGAAAAGVGDDGWFDTHNVEALKIQLIVTTLNGTSITFRVEGRNNFAQQTGTLIAEKTFTAAGSDFIDVTRMLDANWDQVRLGAQILGDSGSNSISAVALGVC